VTRVEARQKLLEVLASWIDNPEGTNRITFERHKGVIPNRGHADLFTVKVESLAMQIALPADAPTILPATAIPAGMPRPPGANGG
jgi:hypothetical protein